MRGESRNRSVSDIARGSTDRMEVEEKLSEAERRSGSSYLGFACKL